MKQVLLIVTTLLLSACNITQYRNVEALQNTTPKPSPTSTLAPTATIVPSATTDYQMTAVIAIQTADEARRVNALITAEFEQREFEKTQMAHAEIMAIENNKLHAMDLTATAAPSAIAGTQTQQAILNTQIPERQNFIYAQMSATSYAPTQIVAMSNAQNRVRYGGINTIAGIFAEFAIGFFCVGFVVYLFKNLRTSSVIELADEEEPEPQAETVTRINLYKNNGATSIVYTIPCTPEQLSELAENITQGKKTLAINQWEGKDTLLTRPVILRVRAWLRDNHFVSIAPDGQLIPSDELLNFLCAWLDRGVLPADYEFEVPHSPESGVSPNYAENTEKTTIDMTLIPMSKGGGVV
jgi:hypothetical protein